MLVGIEVWCLADEDRSNESDIGGKFRDQE